MTIINNIEIDNIKYIHNEIKSAIYNNEPIDDCLHIIIVVSNPCQYARRFILAREFIKRFEQEPNIKLYVVELAYGNQKFYVSEKNNPNHLQIQTNHAPLWHKENMINMGVQKLLPKSWKAFGWIDADVEFENPNWALDTLKILNGCRDIVQLFSHAVDMDKDENTMSIFSSFGFQYTKNKTYGVPGPSNFWHPGFAWAMTRKAYEKIGGLYDLSILGSGDHNMALSLLGKSMKSINNNNSKGYLDSLLSFEKSIINLRLGYIPGVIRHYFHGTKENRKYGERWLILIKHQYNPCIHVTKDKQGLLIPTEQCPKELLDDILKYFAERNEDEGFT